MSCCEQTIDGVVVGESGQPMMLGPSSGNHIELLQASPGVFRIINVGGMFNEGIDFDLDSASDIVAISSSTGATIRFNSPVDINAGVALGAGLGATLGLIGGAGPTAAAQAQWLQVSIGGVVHFIPVWT